MAFTAVALFFAGDLLLLVAYFARREAVQRRLHAPWSLLDVYIGIQFVFFAVLLVATIALIGLNAAFPGSTSYRSRMSPIVTFFALFFPVLLLQFTGLMLVPVGLVRMKYRQSIATLGLRWDPDRTPRQLLLGVLLAVPILPLADLLEMLSRKWLLEGNWLPGAEMLRSLESDAAVMGYLEGIRTHPVALPLMILLFGMIGPIAEEVFFRGFVYKVFRKQVGFPLAAGLSAFMFAAVHVNPVAILPILFSGLVLAVLFEKTGNLAACIGLHCANNLATLAFFLLAPDFRFWRDWAHVQ